MIRFALPLALALAACTPQPPPGMTFSPVTGMPMTGADAALLYGRMPRIERQMIIDDIHRNLPPGYTPPPAIALGLPYVPAIEWDMMADDLDRIERRQRLGLDD
jgi:hypothetical protein